MKEVLKKLVCGIITVAMLLLLGAVPVDASTADKTVVEKYVTSHYEGKTVKYVKEGSSTIKHRKGKSYVVVEHLKTTCQGGKLGKTTKGYTVRYAKADKKGHKVDVYLVYNPRNNKLDDVVCMVDHGRRK